MDVVDVHNPRRGVTSGGYVLWIAVGGQHEVKGEAQRVGDANVTTLRQVQSKEDLQVVAADGPARVG